MAAVLKGLAAIQARMAADEVKNSGGDYVKAKFFSIKDKEAEKVVFLQELDADSPNYSEKNGLGIVAVEHSNPAPGMFKRKALCTLEDEGACWACEQHRLDYKAGWKQKVRLYINAAIVKEGADPEVVVISQGLSDSQISPALFEQAGEFGTITDRTFKIKRSGAGFNDTSYILTALTPHDLDVESLELFDLEKVVRHVPYDQQAAHYLDAGNSTATSAGSEAAPARESVSAGATSAGSDDDTW